MTRCRSTSMGTNSSNATEDDAIPCSRITTGPEPSSAAICRRSVRALRNLENNRMRPVLPTRADTADNRVCRGQRQCVTINSCKSLGSARIALRLALPHEANTGHRSPHPFRVHARWVFSGGDKQQRHVDFRWRAGIRTGRRASPGDRRRRRSQRCRRRSADHHHRSAHRHG